MNVDASSNKRTGPAILWVPFGGCLIGLAFALGILLLDDDWTSQRRIDNAQIAFLGYADAFRPEHCSLSAQHNNIGEFAHVLSPGSKSEIFQIVLDAPSVKEPVMVLETIVDRAVLARCEGNSLQPGRLQAGDLLPYSQRPLQASNLAFPLDNPATSVFLLRTEQIGAVSMQIHVQELSDFKTDAGRKITRHVGLISAISIMIIYNLMLGATSGAWVFLFNALTSFSMLLLAIYMSGFGASHIWPERPELSRPILIASLAGPSLFGPFYLFKFAFMPPLHSARTSALVFAFPVTAVLLILIAPVFPPQVVLITLIALWILLGFIAIFANFRALTRGSEGAGYMLAALLGAVIPAMGIGALKEFLGFRFGPLIGHLSELALALEAILFTLALAYLLRHSRHREQVAWDTLNNQSEQAKNDLLTAIDTERSRVASELHDTVGQGLAIMTSNLKNALVESKPESSRSLQLKAAVSLGVSALGDVRRVSHNLHPGSLAHLGLEMAMQELIAAFNSVEKIHVSLHQEYEGAVLSKDQQLQIYRIVQELVSNAVKHSVSPECRVSLTGNHSKFDIKISEDGTRGHEPDPPSATSGLGKTIVTQRVARLNGHLERKIEDSDTVTHISFLTNPD